MTCPARNTASPECAKIAKIPCLETLKNTKKRLDSVLPLRYNVIMKTKLTPELQTIHEISVLLGEAFEKAHNCVGNAISSNEVLEMLETYKNMRRRIPKCSQHGSRFGAFDAYHSTQGI